MHKIYFDRYFNDIQNLNFKISSRCYIAYRPRMPTQKTVFAYLTSRYPPKTLNKLSTYSKFFYTKKCIYKKIPNTEYIIILGKLGAGSVAGCMLHAEYISNTGMDINILVISTYGNKKADKKPFWL